MSRINKGLIKQAMAIHQGVTIETMKSRTATTTTLNRVVSSHRLRQINPLLLVSSHMHRRRTCRLSNLKIKSRIDIWWGHQMRSHISRQRRQQHLNKSIIKHVKSSWKSSRTITREAVEDLRTHNSLSLNPILTPIITISVRVESSES